MKKLITNILRIVISVGLLYYLVYLADVQKIINLLQNADLKFVVLSVIIFVFALVFLSFRWKLLTKSYGIHVQLYRLFVFYLIGLFFNNFLPTSIGGDLSRAFFLGRQSGDKSGSLGTVLLERLLGLIATLTLASFSMIWVMHLFRTRQVFFYISALVVFVGGIFTVLMSRRLYRLLTKLLSYFTMLNLGTKITGVLDTLHFYRQKKLALLGGYFLSICAQISIIVMNYLLSKALGFHLSLGYFFLVVPVTFLFSLMPSINGVGVRDAGYVLTLKPQGIIASQALSLSFLATLIPIVVSLAGGVFVLFYRAQGVKSPQITEEKP